jgi:ClpP class serine protease
MKSEDLEPLCRGRVYSGISSQRLGLTDSLGGYLEALETARDMAKIRRISKKIRIREYPRPKFYETMAARFFSSGKPAFAACLSRGLSPLPVRHTTDVWEDLGYRFSCNGQIMPLLPLSWP